MNTDEDVLNAAAEWRARGQGKALSYRVIAVDPGAGDDMAHADEVIRDLEEIPSRVTPLTFAVVATHGEYDEPALRAVLGTGVPYVGLVASRARGEAVLESLARDGVDEAARSRVRFPAGLDIQARRGDEIAVSILAEIVQTRRTLGDVSWEGESVGEEEAPHAGSDDAPEAGPEAGTAIDPICHMTVEVDGALHTYAYGGRTYYFCCAGCRTRFMAEPEKYLAAG